MPSVHFCLHCQQRSNFNIALSPDSYWPIRPFLQSVLQSFVILRRFRQERVTCSFYELGFDRQAQIPQSVAYAQAPTFVPAGTIRPSVKPSFPQK
jgi:hypothetical protein